MKSHRPHSPGEIFRDEFMSSWGYSVGELEELLDVDDGDIQNLIDSWPIEESMADELALFFGTTPEYWMNLERAYRDWINFQETLS